MDPTLATVGGAYAMEPLSPSGRRYATAAEAAMAPRHICNPKRNSQEVPGTKKQSATFKRELSAHHQPPTTSSSGPHCSNTCSTDSYQSIPDWQRDLLDLEAGCTSWIDTRQARPLSWLKSSVFPSALEKKVRNPGDCSSISYEIRGTNHLYGFFWRLIAFLVYCILMVGWRDKLGIVCDSTDGSSVDSPKGTGVTTSSRSMLLIWAEALVTAGAAFLIAQGYYSVRAARERLERVRQTAVTLAYSFLKTTSADIGGGHGKEELQVLIYECLALLTAFPVALFHQIQGNTCEPAVTKYCQEVSRKLKRLRDGQDSVGLASYGCKTSLHSVHSHHKYATVEYFFELFSLHLQLEYRQQTLRTKTPSMASQYIIYNLRNHFENIVDMGNLDDRRTPIVRENIDMLALAGRECGIFGRTDIIPVAFLWTVDICCRVLAFGSPIQNCEWLVNSTDTNTQQWQVPQTGLVMSYILVAIISATVMTILDEMWCLWDPFGKAINSLSWTLGIASEIDNMLNEFYEYDTKVLVRKHAYMDPSARLNELVAEECGCERQTV